MAGSDSDRSEDPGLPSDTPQKRFGFVAEFIEFLRFNKKWWLAPILVIMLLLLLLALLTASPVAPFIYTEI